MAWIWGCVCVCVCLHVCDAFAIVQEVCKSQNSKQVATDSYLFLCSKIIYDS